MFRIIKFLTDEKMIIVCLLLLFAVQAAPLRGQQQEIEVAIPQFALGNSGMGRQEADLLLSRFEAALADANASIVVLSRSSFEALYSELDLQYSGAVDESSAAAVGKNLGAKYVLIGEFGALGSRRLFQVKIVDVETARVSTGADRDYDTVENVLEKMESIAIEVAAKMTGGEYVSPQSTDISAGYSDISTEELELQAEKDHDMASVGQSLWIYGTVAFALTEIVYVVIRPPGLDFQPPSIFPVAEGLSLAAVATGVTLDIIFSISADGKDAEIRKRRRTAVLPAVRPIIGLNYVGVQLSF